MCAAVSAEARTRRIASDAAAARDDQKPGNEYTSLEVGAQDLGEPDLLQNEAGRQDHPDEGCAVEERVPVARGVGHYLGEEHRPEE